MDDNLKPDEEMLVTLATEMGLLALVPEHPPVAADSSGKKQDEKTPEKTFSQLT